MLSFAYWLFWVKTHVSDKVIVPVLLQDSEDKESYDTSMKVSADAGPIHSRTSKITPEQASGKFAFSFGFYIIVGD